MYSQRKFAELVNIPRRTLGLWHTKGVFTPEVVDEKGKCFYSDAQIPLAKEYRERRAKALAQSAQCTLQFDTPMTDDDTNAATVTFDTASGTDTDNVGELFTKRENSADTKKLANVTVGAQASIEELRDTNIVESNLAFKASPIDNLTNSAEKTALNKGFLPMTITPNFDATPPEMKKLRRWLCWQLQRADPKPKKVPMTLKNDKLVNAAVNNPDNWLTFADALSVYKQGRCSGIGFALTNTAPKICCVDIDYCFIGEKLTDEAQAVIETIGGGFVEKSQSGTGCHVWFIDDEFNGGRGRKNTTCEVYGTDRYIALTGVFIQGSLETLTGACQRVISKFIDRTADNSNLFDAEKKSARQVDISIEKLKSSMPMTDDDKKLVEYFRSDKCREKDMQMFNLFNGNTDEYLMTKTTGDNSQSAADCALLTKLFYYVGGFGTDSEIQARALRLFEASALSKRDKWLREDYQQSTLAAAFKFWQLEGRKSYRGSDKNTDFIDDDLRGILKELADLDDKKKTALERLRNLQSFDNDAVFSDDIIEAAAFAKLDDRQLFSNVKNSITARNRAAQDKKVSVNDWLAEIKDKAAEIVSRRADLNAQLNQITAEKNSQRFCAESGLNNFIIPAGYSVTTQGGVVFVDGEKQIQVSRRPVVIRENVITDDGTRKTILSYQSSNGKWHNLPPTEKAIIANHRKIVDLANLNLPVTSATAINLVTYLDALAAENENAIPSTREFSRCGWHEINGEKVFVDTRRKLELIDEDDNKVNVRVAENSFTDELKTKGSLEQWRKAYDLARKSPVARFMVAAGVATILLDLLGERNFMMYTYSKTRAGKTTALYLAASAVGSEKLIRSFDATKNGLAGVAAQSNDYPVFIDEKQSAGRLTDNLAEIVYSLANGVGRTKLNRDSTLKKLDDWRTIAIANGETQLLDDNATDGANTRLLQIAAPKQFLSPEDCRQIREIIKDNHGLILPLVIDAVAKYGKDKLREVYGDIQTAFNENFSETLVDHRRFVGLLTLADMLINSVVYGNRVPTDDGEVVKALEDSTAAATELFKLVPTLTDIDSTEKEKNFVRGFVSTNQNRFENNGNVEVDRMQQIFGKLKDKDGYHYIIANTLKDACQSANFNYHKLVADLIDAGFFTPADKLDGERKAPSPTVTKRIGAMLARCHRIKLEVFDE